MLAKALLSMLFSFEKISNLSKFILFLIPRAKFQGASARTILFNFILIDGYLKWWSWLFSFHERVTLATILHDNSFCISDIRYSSLLSSSKAWGWDMLHYVSEDCDHLIDPFGKWIKKKETSKSSILRHQGNALMLLICLCRLKDLHQRCTKEMDAYTGCMYYHTNEFELCRKEQKEFEKACPLWILLNETASGLHNNSSTSAASRFLRLKVLPINLFLDLKLNLCFCC